MAVRSFFWISEKSLGTFQIKISSGLHIIDIMLPCQANWPKREELLCTAGCWIIFLMVGANSGKRLPVSREHFQCVNLLTTSWAPLRTSKFWSKSRSYYWDPSSGIAFMCTLDQWMIFWEVFLSMGLVQRTCCQMSLEEILASLHKPNLLWNVDSLTPEIIVHHFMLVFNFALMDKCINVTGSYNSREDPRVVLWARSSCCNHVGKKPCYRKSVSRGS